MTITLVIYDPTLEWKFIGQPTHTLILYKHSNFNNNDYLGDRNLRHQQVDKTVFVTFSEKNIKVILTIIKIS